MKSPWNSLTYRELVQMLEGIKQRQQHANSKSAGKVSSALRQSIAALNAAEEMKAATRDLLVYARALRQKGKAPVSLVEAEARATLAIAKYLIAVPERSEIEYDVNGEAGVVPPVEA